MAGKSIADMTPKELCDSIRADFTAAVNEKYRLRRQVRELQAQLTAVLKVKKILWGIALEARSDTDIQEAIRKG